MFETCSYTKRMGLRARGRPGPARSELLKAREPTLRFTVDVGIASYVLDSVNAMSLLKIITREDVTSRFL